MNKFTVKWISWDRCKRAHAQVQRKEKKLRTTLCGLDFKEHEESKNPHCVTCEMEIRKHKKEGWIVTEMN